MKQVLKCIPKSQICMVVADKENAIVSSTKPLTIKNHGRRAKSLFRYGLDHLQYVLLNIHQQAKSADAASTSSLIRQGLTLIRFGRVLCGKTLYGVVVE